MEKPPTAEIADLQRRLAELDRERADILAALGTLSQRTTPALDIAPPSKVAEAAAKTALSNADKITLFRSLFRGREDVFPRRWENPTSGKTGYSPACRNEWVRGVCEKPRIKCTDCLNQAFVPVTDDVVRKHLQGLDAAKSRRAEVFVAGVYAMMPDETCWFLAADFDKQSWQRDALAYLSTCREKGVPAALERSRSGNGAHVWISFRSECRRPRRGGWVPIW